MSRRRQRHRTEKQQRNALAEVSAFAGLAVIRQATRIERLAYTRTQAAQALGISTSTFDRRVLPFIETVQMDWDKRLIPTDELERLLAERRQLAQAHSARRAHHGRRARIPAEIVTRIRQEHATGASLAEIARGLNADRVNTSQGGRQWWPSTVRTVITRPNRLDTISVSAAEA